MSAGKVGYRKPSKRHQFKKGQSGNPQGRPKKAKVDTGNQSETELVEKLANETD